MKIKRWRICLGPFLSGITRNCQEISFLPANLQSKAKISELFFKAKSKTFSHWLRFAKSYYTKSMRADEQNSLAELMQGIDKRAILLLDDGKSSSAVLRAFDKPGRIRQRLAKALGCPDSLRFSVHPAFRTAKILFTLRHDEALRPCARAYTARRGADNSVVRHD